MKKAIIIVVVIALLILGAFIWLNQAKPLDKAINNLQQEKSANLVKMQDASLKSATLKLVIMAEDYYAKNPTGVFEKDNNSITQINSYFTGVKSQFGIDIDYFIYSTKTNYVVKTKAKDANSFYCLDSISQEVQPTITESITNFTTTTDCSGAPLK